MTRRVHGYPGFENSFPKALIGKMRSDAAKYRSITVVRSRVRGVKKRGRYFAVRAGSRTFQARYVVIATGVQDIKPSTGNFEKFDGDGAWHCPYCDGLETAGRRLAVIVSGKNPLSFAKEFLGWTQDITMFLHKCRLSKKERDEAAALGIKVVNDTIKQVAGRRGRLPKQLTCGGDRRYAADVVFYKLGYQVQSKLAERLGCELYERYVKVDSEQRTTMAGVYAAGDVDTDRHFVVLAAAAGARAAISIYEKLLKGAISAKVEGHKSL